MFNAQFTDKSFYGMHVLEITKNDNGNVTSEFDLLRLCAENHENYPTYDWMAFVNMPKNAPDARQIEVFLERCGFWRHEFANHYPDRLTMEMSSAVMRDKRELFRLAEEMRDNGLSFYAEIECDEVNEWLSITVVKDGNVRDANDLNNFLNESFDGEHISTALSGSEGDYEPVIALLLEDAGFRYDIGNSYGGVAVYVK